MAFDFWAGWAGGITLLGLLGLAWLAIGVLRDSDVRAPDTAWDDEDGEPLREGNDQPPKWWFFGFFAMLIFSVTYVLLYPGFGDFSGALNWNQQRQLETAEQSIRTKMDEIRARWLESPLAELQNDASAMGSARRIFVENCAGCHGKDGGGQAGMFPDLTDDKWQWGFTETQISHSITRGRRAVMPAWESLGDEKIDAVTDYVMALSEGKDITAAGAAPSDGADIYAAKCVACHGAHGEGGALLGAPAFDGNWLYLSAGETLKQSVQTSIRHGRNGEMPAQETRLSPAQIRLLTAWLTAD